MRCKAIQRFQNGSAPSLLAVFHQSIFALCGQVRLAVNRNQDFRMNNGRAAVEVEYDIGFDDSGKILALEMQVRCTH